MAESTAATWSYLAPVVTLVLGYGLGQLSDWVKDRRTYKRDREARDSARRDALLERRNEFQRETLIRLQEEVAALNQSILELYMERKLASEERGGWPVISHSSDWCNRAIAATIQVQILSVRVHDRNTRALSERYRASVLHLELAQTRDEADNFEKECSMAMHALNDRIAELLRELDRIELAETESTAIVTNGKPKSSIRTA